MAAKLDPSCEACFSPHNSNNNNNINSSSLKADAGCQSSYSDQNLQDIIAKMWLEQGDEVLTILR